MERFYLKTSAAGQPFDQGFFELAEEQVRPLEPMDPAHFCVAQTQFPAEVVIRAGFIRESDAAVR
jgi:hypothetical protein